jgi:hypothetical protein
MSRLLAIIVLAACSHQEPKPATPAPVAPASEPARAESQDVPCEQVATAMIKTGQGVLDLEAARHVVMLHCKDDLWSAEARRCVVASAGDPACEAKFSAAQHREFENDMKAHGITVAHPPLVTPPQQ